MIEDHLKKLRFGLRLLSAFWLKHKRVIFVATMVGFIFFFYFPKFVRAFLPRKAQRVGLVGKFTLEELPLEIQYLIGEGLTTVMPDGEVSPSLANSWEVSEGEKVYLFTLRDDIFWHSGKPVLASDINYNFNDVALTVVDDKNIKFELKESFTPFPVVVSRPVFKKGLVGTGAYRVKGVRRNGQIIETLTLKPTKDKSAPTIIFRFYPTESAARVGFKLGEIDILKEVREVKELTQWKRAKISSDVKLNRFVGIFFDTQSQKFANKSTRQALAYGIDKNWEPRALSSFNPNSWAYNSNVKPYKYDLDKAKSLLEKPEQEDEGPPLEEVELSTIPSLLPVAEEVKTDWEELGIKVKIRIISSLDEPFEALLAVQEIPHDPDQYTLWHSTQATNLSRYKSPKLDKLLEDGRKTLDQEKRREIYQDFQRFLAEDTPGIFLFHPTVYTVSRR